MNTSMRKKNNLLKFYWQSLCGLVFYRHLQVVLVVACNIQVIVDFLVVPIHRPPFVLASRFVTMMNKMTIGHYDFKNALPFCDCHFHIVSWINNFLCLIFLHLQGFIYEFSPLAWLGILALFLHRLGLQLCMHWPLFF
jgi:hypothetical protein